MEIYRRRLKEKGNSWNEEELKIKFIAHLLDFAGYEDQTAFNSYLDREICATIDGIEVKVEADYLLSRGVGEIIETPYFCLHEYKKKKKYIGDPHRTNVGRNVNFPSDE